MTMPGPDWLTHKKSLRFPNVGSPFRVGAGLIDAAVMPPPM